MLCAFIIVKHRSRVLTSYMLLTRGRARTVHESYNSKHSAQIDQERLTMCRTGIFRTFLFLFVNIFRFPLVFDLRLSCLLQIIVLAFMARQRGGVSSRLPNTSRGFDFIVGTRISGHDSVSRNNAFRLPESGPRASLNQTQQSVKRVSGICSLPKR